MTRAHVDEPECRRFRLCHRQVFVAVAKKPSKDLSKTTDAQLASVLGRQPVRPWPGASGTLLTLAVPGWWRGLADAGDPGDADRRMLFMDLWRQSAAVKLDAMNDYVRDLLENGQKFLLFAHHQFVMDSFAENLTKQVRAPWGDHDARLLRLTSRALGSGCHACNRGSPSFASMAKRRRTCASSTATSSRRRRTAALRCLA